MSSPRGCYFSSGRQVGSKVKSLIAGQNLMPGNFGMKNDLANCSYLALGDAIDTCKNYKVKSSYPHDEITSQKEQIDEGRLTDPSLMFTGLYCPSLGSVSYCPLRTAINGMYKKVQITVTYQTKKNISINEKGYDKYCRLCQVLCTKLRNT